MSTLIQVNEHLRVSKLMEYKSIVLCQNVDNGEFVVWYKGYAASRLDNEYGFCGGYYTPSLPDAMLEFDRRANKEF